MRDNLADCIVLPTTLLPGTIYHEISRHSCLFVITLMIRRGHGDTAVFQQRPERSAITTESELGGRFVAAIWGIFVTRRICWITFGPATNEMWIQIPSRPEKGLWKFSWHNNTELIVMQTKGSYIKYVMNLRGRWYFST